MDKIESDVCVRDGYVDVKGIGVVGLWWEHYDKKVCLSYGFGESFIANNEKEVIDGILKIVNHG